MRRFVKIRTRNFTAKPLRGTILSEESVVVRLGSHTPTNKIFPVGRKVIEINTLDAIGNSRDKIRMKTCFKKLNVPQAEWWSCLGDMYQDKNKEFPIVIKRICGFQGRGMVLINNQEELNDWANKHPGVQKGEWFAEKFYNYAREYRLHVGNGEGVFLSWRKLRTDKAKERWFFNSVNSNWVGEEHKLFDRPKCWKEMEEAAINAAKSTGLDLGAVDIRVQSNTQKNPKFIVCEINSAPALGELGVEKYKEVIRNIIKNKTHE